MEKPVIGSEMGSKAFTLMELVVMRMLHDV